MSVPTLVTGGAGFVGSHLVARLVELGVHVRVADNLERGRLAYLESVRKRIDFRQLDLRDRGVCVEACEGMEIVFHLASKVGGIGYYLSRPGEVFTQNTRIDLNVWEAAQQAGVKRYLYASSAHVYPIELQRSPEAPAIREEQAYPANPELSYGWAKLLGERLIEFSLAEGSPVRAAIVRIIGAYGPHQDIDLATGSAIPVFIRRAIEYPTKGPFVVLGTGEETRSYCYVGDIVEGLIRAVEKLDEHPLVGPLNLGSEERIRIGDLARQISTLSGKDIEITWDRSHPTAIWGQALDCSKARELLDGWRPRVSLREGLEITYSDIHRRLAEMED